MNTPSDQILGSCLGKFLCPAKLNIGLRITSRRENGFHELQSLFWPIDLTDEIEIQKGEGVTCEWNRDAPCPDRDLPSENDNLVSKILKSCDVEKRLRVQMKKRIPVGAGLGGGSSNAAGLLRRLGQKPSPEFGADIPFFFEPQPTLVEGIGEKRRAVICDPGLFDSLVFALVFPETPLSTPQVFQKFRVSNAPFSPPAPVEPQQILTREAFENFARNARNDLEKPAISLAPEINDILHKLRELPALYAGMSGSGSTCFAVFDRPPQTTIKEFHQMFRNTNCKIMLARSFTESVSSTWMRKLETLQGVQHGNNGSQSVPSQRGTPESLRHDHL